MIEIYTDGSCTPTNPGPGGWAVIINNPEDPISLCGSESWTTNNRMELTAMIEAICWCLDADVDDVVIYSDSKYVVDGYNDWMHKWVKKKWNKRGGIKNKDLWKLLYKCYQDFGGKVKWVAGHSGVEGNESADLLADSAARDQISEGEIGG